MAMVKKALGLLTLPLFFLSLLVTPSTASALASTPIVLADCATEPTIPCIESIRIKDASGTIRSTSLTGRSALVDTDFTGKGYQEYSVNGLSFEGTSKNLFIPRIVYYPYSSDEWCSDAGVCHRERDYLAVGVQPSWLNRAQLDPFENELALSNRPTNLLCGTKENRDKCYRSNNFEVDVDFVITMRMPRSFSPIWASGSARNISINEWGTPKNQTQEYFSLVASIGTLDREMVLFSDYYKNPLEAIDSSPFADYPADWPGIWIHGSRDQSVNPLGSCRGTPFMSVSTNGIYQEVPRWNEQTESIDLKLYAPHRRVDGQLNRGFYELQVSQELAKCFWGIDASDQTQARVLISYPDSQQEQVIETTSVSFAAGILRVLATNFTFSSPTIKTKLVKVSEGPRKEVSTKVETRATPTSKNSQITCTKGTQTKLITAKKNCPKGFKRLRK